MTEKHSQDSIPSVLRQELHLATGDREHEAKALRDRAGGAVDEDAALEAVRETHGDVAGGPPTDTHPKSETATPADVAAVEERRRSSNE